MLDWPQSRERLPVRRIVRNDAEAVSEVAVTDGVQHGVAISFITLAGSKIARIVAYWPEPYAAAPNRAHLVEVYTE